MLSPWIANAPFFCTVRRESPQEIPPHFPPWPPCFLTFFPSLSNISISSSRDVHDAFDILFSILSSPPQTISFDCFIFYLSLHWNFFPVFCIVSPPVLQCQLQHLTLPLGFHLFPFSAHLCRTFTSLCGRIHSQLFNPTVWVTPAPVLSWSAHIFLPVFISVDTTSHLLARS